MNSIPKKIAEWSKFNDFANNDSNEDIVKKLLIYINHEHLLSYIDNITKEFNELVKENGKHNNVRALIGIALGYLYKRNLLNI